MKKLKTWIILCAIIVAALIPWDTGYFITPVTIAITVLSIAIIVMVVIAAKKN